MRYERAKTSQISFPVGGIGSGSLGLAGDGRLVDWEIFNRPNKNSLQGFSHFAVKAEKDGKLVDARVLQGDLKPPYTGVNRGTLYSGFGFGPARESMSGLPHFSETEFNGAFPFAEMLFKDSHFPGTASLTAFNPLIPLNEKDSSIPAAFFEVGIVNTSESTLDYTVAFTTKNPNPKEKNLNSSFKDNGISGITLGSTCAASEKELNCGDITVATDANATSIQECWFRGAWFDSLIVFWKDFCAAGGLKNRKYGEPNKSGDADHGTLAAHFNLAPGKTGKIRFIVSWNFPFAHNYWNPPPCDCVDAACGKPGSAWRNYYATIFRDSKDSAAYSLKNWERLHADTRLFKDALFSSTLPEPVLDAVSANISILKTPTCLRLEDGSFYGFEGCHSNAGCCEGSCTHVWNYAYAMPFLFPNLERSMRDLDYKHNLRADGGMPFRLQLPVGREMSNFRPCVDGQLGGVVKVYRDWKISGDTPWLRKIWPLVRKSLEFAWSEGNSDLWDPGKSGVITGRQHHTLDVELFGANAWLTGFYLAALKAGAEMAEICGEQEAAQEYLCIFEKGKAFVDANLFNGEYYSQVLDLNDQSLFQRFPDASDFYWNREHGEIKYQIDDGCGIDQVIAQWHANICGLGEIFDPGKTREALRSIYKYNFKNSFREFPNFYRVYALNDEGGTLMFSWPEGKRKPVVPIPYAEETMHGFEYQAAAHMIMEGMLEEGCELVKAVRDRYDGERRNPWNEIECGSNYARSMASYSLLNAFSGFSCNVAQGEIGFNPPGQLKGPLNFFWSLGTGWGTVEIGENHMSLHLLYGELRLNKITIPSAFFGKCLGKVLLDGVAVSGASIAEAHAVSVPGLQLSRGSRLTMEFD
jgi:uncharacterized protein (DUF608 family)